MTDLTEKWKNGELERGWYYINNGQIDYKYSKHSFVDFFVTPHEDIKEVLAPVPTYQEYLESEAHCAVYSEENKRLKAEIERLQFENQHVIWLKHRNEALDKDNKQLRRLLKECREKLEELNHGTDVYQGDLTDFVEKIDEVLK